VKPDRDKQLLRARIHKLLSTDGELQRRALNLLTELVARLDTKEKDDGSGSTAR
jgi:hypothetical protein